MGLIGLSGRPRGSVFFWKCFSILMCLLFCFLEVPKITSWAANNNNKQESSTMEKDDQLVAERFLEEKQIEEEDKKENKTDASILQWLKDRKMVYSDRQKRIVENCQKYNVTLNLSENYQDVYNKIVDNDYGHNIEYIKMSQFSLARSQQMMGCFINKVASSTFAKAFLTLEGIRVDKISSPHAFRSRLEPKSPKELHFSRDHFYKFMFVRHPMERLVSCYYDKLMVNPHKSLKPWRKAIKFIARKIISKAKNNNTTTSNDVGIRAKRDVSNNAISSALEMRNQILAMRRRIQSSPPQSENQTSPTQTSLTLNESFNNQMDLNSSIPPFIEKNMSQEDEALIREIFHGKVVIPTFTEFLEYILSTNLQGDGFSSHWVPFWRQCTPCHFKYDMIGKLETGNDDFSYLWKLTGMETKVPILWEHLGVTSSSEQADQHKEKMRSFYSKVPRELLIRVYNAYKLDFELFDYDFNQVLILAGYKPME